MPLDPRAGQLARPPPADQRNPAARDRMAPEGADHRAPRLAPKTGESRTAGAPNARLSSRTGEDVHQGQKGVTRVDSVSRFQRSLDALVGKGCGQSCPEGLLRGTGHAMKGPFGALNASKDAFETAAPVLLKASFGTRTTHSRQDERAQSTF